MSSKDGILDCQRDAHSGTDAVERAFGGTVRGKDERWSGVDQLEVMRQGSVKEKTQRWAKSFAVTSNKTLFMGAVCAGSLGTGYPGRWVPAIIARIARWLLSGMSVNDRELSYLHDFFLICCDGFGCVFSSCLHGVLGLEGRRRV